MAAPAAVHGAGRHGRAAWPRQHRLEHERRCLFLERLAPGDPPDVVVAHLAERVDGPMHVVAHSYGALPVPAGVVGRVPTLVAVGSRHTMYGEVAAALEDRGARVLVVPGSGHRPQDTDAFAAALAAHRASAEQSR